MSTFLISRVKVGPRHRKDLGNIDDLVESIREVGLIHPIVLDKDGNLIAGERRLQACTRLGWLEIPATRVDLADDTRLRVEMDENTIRKDFTPSEMVAIKKAIAEQLKTPTGRPPKGTSKVCLVSPARPSTKPRPSSAPRPKHCARLKR